MTGFPGFSRKTLCLLRRALRVAGVNSMIPEPQMSSVEPERLLHYRIISKVGEGGMGQVYRAEDTKLGRNVALKLLTPDATRDQSAKRRLLSEAQSASVLNHPNI